MRSAISSAQALNPLKSRFLEAFDGTLSDAQINDWTAALDEFSAGYDQLSRSFQRSSHRPNSLWLMDSTFSISRSRTSSFVELRWNSAMAN